jgi:hypothetical protein
MGIQGPPSENIESSSADESNHLAAELSMLSEMQYEALLKSSYLRMAKAEREAYDRRRERIGQLCRSITKYRPKDADAAD